MVKVTLGEVVLAESSNTVVVEGNHYFPPEDVNMDYFVKTDLHTHCPWKGDASYYTVDVNGKEVVDGAWYYPTPMDAAKNIKNYVAFYKNKFKIDD